MAPPTGARVDLWMSGIAVLLVLLVLMVSAFTQAQSHERNPLRHPSNLVTR